MLIGYMRVSKADGSQTVDLQRDALLAAGIDADHLYDDHASGRRDDRPGLAACLKALRDGNTLRRRGGSRPGTCGAQPHLAFCERAVAARWPVARAAFAVVCVGLRPVTRS
jgi:hypothetical protein